ncbi:MAG: aminotransferase class V-fold PLP-dependent enzyme [Nocardioidaceae bacterium]
MAPLTLPPDQMRRLGYQVVDLIVDSLAGLRDHPPASRASAEELAGILDEPIPRTGSDPEQVLREAVDDVLRPAMRVDHPRFLAYVPIPSNYIGMLADALMSGFGVFAGTWQAASGAAAAELTTLRWLCNLFGLPDTAGGLFVDGGSSANMYGLIAARRAILDDQLGDAVVYASDQTHSWIGRALRVLGFQPAQLRLLSADEECRLRPSDVRAAVTADRAAGRRPFCMVATAGTTSTGSVDPLADLAALCRDEGLWFHVDGAFGGPAVLTEEGRALLTGIELADSLALDAHKWLFQPLEAGCVLVRDVALLESIFSTHPEYLLDAAARDREVNFADRGIQLTRSFRAFKLWLSLKVFGLDAFEQAVQHGLDLARHCDAILRRTPGWEVLAPTVLAVVTFRYTNESRTSEELEAINRRIADAMLVDELATLSSTVLGGRTALRMCTVNPRTTTTDVEMILGRLREVAAAAVRAG